MPKRSSIKKQRKKSKLTTIAEADVEDKPILMIDGKNAAAVALGRKGGLKGGKARAAKLSADQRSKIARKAALARWEKKRNG